MIVVGGDTADGKTILGRLWSPKREVRAFVTDESVGQSLKRKGYKVAIGDVSDESHIEAASMQCFSAVLIVEAAEDNRERSFAETPRDVIEGWGRAAAAAGVTRVIWVSQNEVPNVKVPEAHMIDPRLPDLADQVVTLDDAQPIDRDS